MSHLFILAQTAASTQPVQGSPTMMDAILQMAPLLLIIAGFYFLVIVPQQNKEKELQKLIKEIQKGDEVVTIGGVIGTIETLSEDRVTLKTADKTFIQFQRASIASKVVVEASNTKKA